MTNEERKIYDLVVPRFLAVLCPVCEYEETAVKAQLGSEVFHAKGNVLTSPGWREAYASDHFPMTKMNLRIPQLISEPDPTQPFRRSPHFIRATGSRLLPLSSKRAKQRRRHILQREH
mgnify:CR=1 FL=1